jgi:hypothetical protein
MLLVEWVYFYCLSKLFFHFARVVKLVDTTDLKSVGEKSLYRFKSGPGHQFIVQASSKEAQAAPVDRCLLDSDRHTPALTETFRLATLPSIGMRTS